MTAKAVEVPSILTVRELAELIDASPIEVIKELMSNGIMASINQQIDYDTAALIIAEMGYEPAPVRLAEPEEDEDARVTAAWRRVYEKEAAKDLVSRPAIVAVLGHVDHGKTSLLDVIRHTNVQAGEYGGITQHIGAYQVQHNGQKITFLDTPGHEAFTAMRARGAQGADVAILVVAADDGIMPQTREAIAHAQAAKVPIIVAVNKIDLPSANLERVKQQLAEIGLVPDEWDGDTLVVPVSAKLQAGLEDLLEAIILVTDGMDITANPKAPASGTVLEGELDPRRGVLATLLVQNGTLKVGDVIVAGLACGKIRAMFDERGKRVKQAEPSTPVQVMGLDEVPVAGELFEKAENDRTARAIVQERLVAAEEAAAQPGPAFTLEDAFERFMAGETKELNLIIKSDVQGTLEPITKSLNDLKVSDLKVNILHAETGSITDSDVMLASASDAIILGFQVPVDPAAQRRADSEGVDIRTYNIIYKLIEDVEQALQGMLAPVYEDVRIGMAEVRQVFHIRRVGQVAGSYVRDGEIRRGAKARVVRNRQPLQGDSKISSLKRFEEDVREVRAGFECGIGLDNFNDFQEGDIIECYVTQRVT
ncbi:MAG: translation initiation factor IF-2 [Anaerolineae bacterium]|nr:translation initiation factor IF-2 [Anaerolineae bacterium]